MDPQATLLNMLESLAARDTEEALGAFNDLAEWIAKGGLIPEELHAALDAVRFHE